MTIDELLAEAAKYASLAVNGNGDRALFAQIAQACAQTAQAMILAQMTDARKIEGGCEIRIMRVDAGYL